MSGQETIGKDALPFPNYTLGEEIANAVTHGIGVCLSISALVLLIVRAATRGTASYVVGYSIFGTSAILLYLASTIYHSLVPSKGKRVFASLDHSAIFVLIAGSYTAYCLGPLYGWQGWWIFGTIWALAAIGVVAYSVYGSRASKFTFTLYLVMGWFVVLVTERLYVTLPRISWIMLVLGGVAYTVGCVFYALKNIRWMHSIWHLFVLAGTILHFFSLYWAI